MEKSSEPSPSPSDTEVGSENGPEVGTGAEREMIIDSDVPDASDEDWLDQLTPRQIVA